MQIDQKEGEVCQARSRPVPISKNLTPAERKTCRNSCSSSRSRKARRPNLSPDRSGKTLVPMHPCVDSNVRRMPAIDAFAGKVKLGIPPPRLERPYSSAGRTPANVFLFAFASPTVLKIFEERSKSRSVGVRAGTCPVWGCSTRAGSRRSPPGRPAAHRREQARSTGHRIGAARNQTSAHLHIECELSLPSSSQTREVVEGMRLGCRKWHCQDEWSWWRCVKAAYEICYALRRLLILAGGRSVAADLSFDALRRRL